jgi:hypothetical protein
MTSQLYEQVYKASAKRGLLSYHCKQVKVRDATGALETADAELLVLALFRILSSHQQLHDDDDDDNDDDNNYDDDNDNDEHHFDFDSDQEPIPMMIARKDEGDDAATDNIGACNGWYVPTSALLTTTASTCSRTTRGARMER